MFITSFEIIKYKSICNTRITELVDINMFFGFNNSGKSNILKFLDLVFSKKNIYQNIKTNYQDLELNDTTTQRVVSYEQDFWKGDVNNTRFIFHKNLEPKIEFTVTLKFKATEVENFDYIMKYVINTKKIRREVDSFNLQLKGNIAPVSDNTSRISIMSVNINEVSIFDIINGIPDYFKGSKGLRGNHELFDLFMSNFNNIVLFLDTNRYLIFEKDTKIDYLDSPSVFKNWLFNLSLNYNTYSKFLLFTEFLRNFKITDNNYSETAIKTTLQNNSKSFPLNTGNIYFSRLENNELEIMLNNKIGRLPLSNFGAGVQQLFYILARIFNSDSRIVLIEELELNLSHKYQYELLNFLKLLMANENKKIDQVLFTTHSNYFCKNYNLVSGLYEVALDDDCCTTVKKSNKNRTKGYFNDYFK